MQILIFFLIQEMLKPISDNEPVDANEHVGWVDEGNPTKILLGLAP